MGKVVIPWAPAAQVNAILEEKGLAGRIVRLKILRRGTNVVVETPELGDSELQEAFADFAADPNFGKSADELLMEELADKDTLTEREEQQLLALWIKQEVKRRRGPKRTPLTAETAERQTLDEQKADLDEKIEDVLQESGAEPSDVENNETPDDDASRDQAPKEKP
jgi:hypothetical protein